MKTYKTMPACLALLFSACAIEGTDTMKCSAQTESAMAMSNAELSINEVLFDPIKDGVDFVEIVNISPYDLNLAEYCIRNRNSAGALGTARPLSKEKRMLPAGGYCLLTADYERLRMDHPCCDDSMHLNISSFPSLPNEAGEVILTAYDDRIVDEFDYSRTMHYPLISNREGISLEKIHPMLASSESQYWCSASTDAGYATPGRVNSQYREMKRHTADSRESPVSFFLERPWVAPGRLDSSSYVCLNYVCASCDEKSWQAHPFVAEVTLYSWEGVPLLSFAQNALLGSQGCFVWNGLDASGEVLPYGCYVIKVTCFNQDATIYKVNIPCSIIP